MFAEFARTAQLSFHTKWALPFIQCRYLLFLESSAKVNYFETFSYLLYSSNEPVGLAECFLMRNV